MKTITISSRGPELDNLLEQALEENLILRTSDGHEFLLVEIADFDCEVELTRGNEDLMRLLDVRGEEKATISLDEARARLGLDSR